MNNNIAVGYFFHKLILECILHNLRQNYFRSVTNFIFNVASFYFFPLTWNKKDHDDVTAVKMDRYLSVLLCISCMMLVTFTFDWPVIRNGHVVFWSQTAQYS